MFINGLNLGRYWSIGPQQSLYLPGPYLNSGTNEVQTRVNHNFYAILTLSVEPLCQKKKKYVCVTNLSAFLA